MRSSSRLRPARRNHDRIRYERFLTLFRSMFAHFARFVIGTVLQPRCTILAMSGPIILGSNNIVEENVVIVNRLKQPMVIGDNNLFEVGCRQSSLASSFICSAKSLDVDSMNQASNHLQSVQTTLSESVPEFHLILSSNQTVPSEQDASSSLLHSLYPRLFPRLHHSPKKKADLMHQTKKDQIRLCSLPPRPLQNLNQSKLSCQTHMCSDPRTDGGKEQQRDRVRVRRCLSSIWIT